MHVNNDFNRTCENPDFNPNSGEKSKDEMRLHLISQDPD